MCGRAAQTLHAVSAASRALGLDQQQTEPSTSTPSGAPPANNNANRSNNNNNQQQQQQGSAISSGSASSRSNSLPHQSAESSSTSSSEATRSSPQDNYNMSPGMEATVFWKDHREQKICSGRKKWGLVTRGGSRTTPLPNNMNQHFSNLMFNARSDTLYIKPTFARLASAGKTCLVAVDGFFEWKAEGPKGSRKQPYFVFRKQQNDQQSQQDRPYLLMAGLWTSVPTGREADPTLDTFTILTTDACESLRWLHSRMPVFIWDERLAQQWLERPNERLFREIDEAAVHTPQETLQWHAVTKDMSSTKFRSSTSIKATKATQKTVTSFFGPAYAVKTTPAATPSSSSKRASSIAAAAAAAAAQSSPSKKMKTSATPKKGSIQSYFSRK